MSSLQIKTHLKNLFVPAVFLIPMSILLAMPAIAFLIPGALPSFQTNAFSGILAVLLFLGVAYLTFYLVIQGAFATLSCDDTSVHFDTLRQSLSMQLNDLDDVADGSATVPNAYENGRHFFLLLRSGEEHPISWDIRAGWDRLEVQTLVNTIREELKKRGKPLPLKKNWPAGA